MTQGDVLAQAAQALVGARFRLHGRDPATGLDCIGLLHAALTVAGHAPVLPNGYRLRSRPLAGLDGHAMRNGFAAVQGATHAGDVFATSLAGCQYHLLIALGANRYVHAHAGIGRVVLHCGVPPGTITGHWRLAGAAGALQGI